MADQPRARIDDAAHGIVRIVPEDDSPFGDQNWSETDFGPREDTRSIIVSAGSGRHGKRRRIWAAGSIAIALVVVTAAPLGSTGALQFSDEDTVELGELEIGDPGDANDTNRRKGDGAALRDKLLGIGSQPTTPSAPAAPPPEKTLDARALFQDQSEQPASLSLQAREIRADVAVPDGLTGEAIAEVVQSNSTAARLCIAEGIKAGETRAGKAEFEVAISASGAVDGVKTRTPAFQNTRLATCMSRTIARWRFPSFDGPSVAVIIPYVITEGL